MPTTESVDVLSVHSHTFYIPVRIMELNSSSLLNINAETPSLARILVIRSGHGLLHLGGHHYSLTRGSAAMCNVSPNLEWQVEFLTPLQGVMIEYRALTTDGSKPRALDTMIPPLSCPGKTVRLAAELLRLWKAPGHHDSFRIQQSFTELLADLHQEMTLGSKPASLWMDQVLSYMETHYDEDLSREQVAGIAGVSNEHFSRAFHRHTGQTFNAYLAMLRIRSAQQRLLTGSPHVNTLAIDVGYKEATYFSRKFKQLVGLSPTAYQHKNKQVAALNFNHTAILLALGITPVLGVYNPWLENVKPVSSEKKLRPHDEIDDAALYKAVAATHPDVIINYSSAQANKALRSIAPVLELPVMSMDWREQFRFIADIVARKQQAESWLKRYDELAAAINRQLDQRPRSRGTAVVWEIGPNEAYCFSSHYGRGCQILYDDLGFSPPDELLEQD